LKFISNYYKKENGSSWLVADPVGGPPEPLTHSFKDMRFTCDSCSQAILKGLRYLRETYDIDGYLDIVQKLESCFCKDKYLKYLKEQKSIESTDILKRIKENIDFAHINKVEYIENIRNNKKYLKNISGVKGVYID
jgi:hypothetical protein